MGGRGGDSGDGGGGGTQGAPLTPERQASLVGYQEKGHTEINKALREGTGEKATEIQHIHELMDTATEEQVVYRGLDGQTSREIYEEVNDNPGSIIRDQGFMSTTQDSMVSRIFSSYGSYRLGITVKEGTKMIDMNEKLGKASVQKGEKEILLDKGTSLRYTHTDELTKIMYFETIP